MLGFRARGDGGQDEFQAAFARLEPQPFAAI